MAYYFGFRLKRGIEENLAPFNFKINVLHFYLHIFISVPDHFLLEREGCSTVARKLHYKLDGQKRIICPKITVRMRWGAPMHFLPEDATLFIC